MKHTIDAAVMERVKLLIEDLKDQQHNPFEPDNQSKMFHRICEALSLLQSAQGQEAEGADPVEQGERLEKLARKWTKETRANLITKLHALDADTLEENFRHAIEEWMGETRQQPLPETEKELDAILNKIADKSAWPKTADSKEG